MAIQNRHQNHSKNHSPSYLVHTRYGYYFRFRVPVDLQRLLGIKSELRYSLRTGSLREAREKARLLAGQIQKLFRQLRRKGNYMASELSESQIRDIIKGYVKDVLEEDEQERVNLLKPEYGSILNRSGRQLFYRFSDPLMRGFARLAADSEGIELAAGEFLPT